jgi:uncharacterized MAPEG superfamily protein
LSSKYSKGDSTLIDLDSKQIKAIKIVIAYPFGVLAIAILINLFVLGIDPIAVSLPSKECVWALSIAAIIFCVNHTWLMTATELTRVRYKTYATPEEWEASGTSRKDISDRAFQELERAHNAHRNTNENALYFMMLAIPFVVSTPSIQAVLVWIIGFSITRLGYTYSYLKGKDDLRGAFMTLGLVATYGIASYLFIGIIGLRFI